MSQIKDIKLAPSGADKIAWVASYMPILNSIKEEFEKIEKLCEYNSVKVLNAFHKHHRTTNINIGRLR